MNAKHALLIALAALLAGSALARASFDQIAYQQLRFQERPGSALERSSCQLCHARAQGGAPWNAFGLAIGKFRAKKLPIDRAMFEQLKLEADVDQDGYSDALEVFAGTLPGDGSSKPGESLEALKGRLVEAGGVERYAPKR